MWLYWHKNACVCVVLGTSVKYAKKNMFFSLHVGKAGAVIEHNCK